jgi:hypothetical protein
MDTLWLKYAKVIPAKTIKNGRNGRKNLSLDFSETSKTCMNETLYLCTPA